MHHARRRRGFSVLELTIAIAILGVMMAIAGVALLPALGRAKISATETTMLHVGQALTQHKADTGRFPDTLQELVDAEFLVSYPTDGWDRDFFYSPDGAEPDEFILISLGEDGQDGTDDDIRYEDLIE